MRVTIQWNVYRRAQLIPIKMENNVFIIVLTIVSMTMLTENVLYLSTVQMVNTPTISHEPV